MYMLEASIFEKIKIYLSAKSLKLLMLFTAVLSALSYAWSSDKGYSLAYGDAMSHLNISRLVIDNIEPGISQLGSVWLPLNHVLSLSLVWNDWAWHSGFAGSIFSMIAYVISVWGIYKSIEIVTKDKTASLLGGVIFAVNLNMLYLQTTPLTEPLYLMFFVLSVLYFIKFIIKGDPKYLFILGALGFLQVLARYDGWFVVGVEFLLIAYYEILYRKGGLKDTVGKLTVFVFPIIFGVGLWFIWNLLIFGDPLYFAIGPYSAKSQQTTIESNAGLITKNNLNIASLAYWYDMLAVVGKYVIVLAFAGLVSFFFQKKLRIDLSNKALVLVLLVSPIIFNILALYLGFSIINLPELGWNPSGEFSNQWFNTRYGIFALPFAAFFIGIISNLKKTLIYIAVILITIFQTMTMQRSGIITLVDGTVGSSSFAHYDIALELENKVSSDEKVIVSTSFFNPVLFKSGFHLEQFIHEGVSREWSEAIAQPEEYARWIVMANGDVGEPVYTTLVNKQNNRFLSFYKLSYEGKHARIYKLRDKNELFVSRDGNTMMTGKKPIVIRGVNSYDLAYKTDEEIDDTFQNLHEAGVNTVRFWMFGDGYDEGFQPEAGIMNEERFKKADLIIFTASKHDIKLIPSLVNHWQDLGGKKQYLVWTGKTKNGDNLFYSDEETKKIFKNYINHVISRENSITHNIYAEEASILGWEIINEPRITEGKEDILVDWTTEMADYIRQIDPNHLILSGTEQAISLTEKQTANICGIPSIDICSVHLYLYNEKNEILYSDLEQVNQYLSLQADYADKMDKPIIVGEFGIPKYLYPFGREPSDVIEDISGFISKNGYRGYLVWNWSIKNDDSFGFSIAGDKDGKYDLLNLETIIGIDG
ncbi:MAG: cellulase family glycosylhydrolase [Candidatus Pacebacteria bacterium]|nr:cellulase family glycosylhydrolase [Candidatus Paceibacterota bacterium]